MIKKVEYKTNTERNLLLLENENLYLWEEQNIGNGNFLIFVDRERIGIEPIPSEEEPITTS